MTVTPSQWAQETAELYSALLDLRGTWGEAVSNDALLIAAALLVVADVIDDANALAAS